MTYIPTGPSGVTTVFGRNGEVVAEDGDYSSDQVSNSSAVSGITITDALETLNSKVSSSVVFPGLALSAAPIYTQIMSFLTEAERSYSAEVRISLSQGPVTTIVSGLVILNAAFHRNTAGSAVVSGFSVNPVGSFGGITGRVSASGNSVLFEVRVSAATTANVTVDYKFNIQTPS